MPKLDILHPLLLPDEWLAKYLAPYDEWIRSLRLGDPDLEKPATEVEEQCNRVVKEWHEAGAPYDNKKVLRAKFSRGQQLSDEEIAIIAE